MRVRSTDRPTIRLAGHASRVPLIHEGVNPLIANPLIAAHVAAIPVEEHRRLKELSNTSGGLLQVTTEPEPDGSKGRAHLPPRSRDHRRHPGSRRPGLDGCARRELGGIHLQQLPSSLLGDRGDLDVVVQ